MAIGIIGVGLLGSAIATRLSQSGSDVFGFDIRNDHPEDLKSRVTFCATSGEVFDSCDVVILSLPSSEVVVKLLDGNENSLRPTMNIIDTTTGDPAQIIAIADRIHGEGASYIEATVAGSSEQLKSGEAVLFVSSDGPITPMSQTVLSQMAENHFHIGSVGAASKFKLVHNLILGLNRAVLAEGLHFAETLGFSSDSTLKILVQTPAQSSVMSTKGPKMVNRDYDAQARLSQHLKDVRLIIAESERFEAYVPLSRKHADLLEAAVEHGFGELDNCAIMELFRTQQNIRLE